MSKPYFYQIVVVTTILSLEERYYRYFLIRLPVGKPIIKEELERRRMDFLFLFMKSSQMHLMNKDTQLVTFDAKNPTMTDELDDILAKFDENIIKTHVLYFA
ncbi:MAG: hypothetical protein WDZ88_03275 [Candidatus Paceibacterota bacterium]